AAIVAIGLLSSYIERMLIGGSAAPQQPGLAPASGQTVDGIECQTMEGAVIHIHAYIEFYANDQEVTVPAGVGIVAPPGGDTSALASNGSLECFYALHVHDDEEDIIHIESPVRRTYTLGELFDIWGQPLSSTQVLNYQADANHKLMFQVFDAKG